MKFLSIIFTFTIFGIIQVCNSYRILAIYALPIRSHFIMINEVLKGLLEKGHKVDVINALSHDEANPNYTQIIKLGETENILSNGFTYNGGRNISFVLNLINTLGNKICENIGNPEFLHLSRNPPKDPPYDVIISQIMNYHCFTILGHLWNVPVVLISTTSLYPWMHDMIGNPENIAISNSNIQLIDPENTFLNRLQNTLTFHLFKFGYLYYSSYQNELLRKYYGPDVPTVRELERNISLVLMNTYFTINGVKPTTPALIEVGGLHIQNNGPELSKDLKIWLDESTNGVIYFNFGSIIRIERISENFFDIIIKILGNLSPTRVLIKIIDPKLVKVKIPNNFYVSSWLPQEKILQHPNVKAFITHGGLLGTQESIFYGVPMLCMPFFADQFTNANNYVKREVALIVDISTITEEKFSYAVNEILNNPIYRKNVKKLSRLFNDRPKNSLDTAIFWIEYVIRNGKNSLRSAAMDLTWWQIMLLDVYVAIFGTLLVTLLIIIYIIKKLFSLLRMLKRNISKEKKLN